MNKENLKLKAPEYKNDVEIYIEADENEGDYVSKTEFTDLKKYEILLPILKKIKYKFDWENKEIYLTQDEIDYLEFYVPTGNYADVHTIVDVKCWFLSKEDNIRYEIEL